MSAAESAFINQLIRSLRVTVPDVDPSTLVGLGAIEIRNDHFRNDQIPGIVVSHMHGIKVAIDIASWRADCFIPACQNNRSNHLRHTNSLRKPSYLSSLYRHRPRNTVSNRVWTTHEIRWLHRLNLMLSQMEIAFPLDGGKWVSIQLINS